MALQSPALTWSDTRFTTGIDEIDEQHRKLFDLANELLEATSTGRPDAEVERILDDLGQWVAEHFCCEEELMEQRRCSACVANKVAHEWFLDDYRALRELFARDGVTPELSKAVEKDVCHWLESHLLAIDLTLRENNA